MLGSIPSPLFNGGSHSLHISQCNLKCIVSVSTHFIIILLHLHCFFPCPHAGHVHNQHLCRVDRSTQHASHSPSLLSVNYLRCRSSSPTPCTHPTTASIMTTLAVAPSPTSTTVSTIFVALTQPNHHHINPPRLAGVDPRLRLSPFLSTQPPDLAMPDLEHYHHHRYTQIHTTPPPPSATTVATIVVRQK